MSLINPSLEVVYCSNLASDYSLIRFIRFVSPFTDSNRNAFFISSRFKSLCRCRKFFLEFGILQPNTGLVSRWKPIARIAVKEIWDRDASGAALRPSPAQEPRARQCNISVFQVLRGGLRFCRDDWRSTSGEGSSSSKLDSVTSAPWLQAAAMIPLLYLGSSDYCRCVYAALTKAEMEAWSSIHFRHQARNMSVVDTCRHRWDHEKSTPIRLSELMK